MFLIHEDLEADHHVQLQKKKKIKKKYFNFKNILYKKPKSKRYFEKKE